METELKERKAVEVKLNHKGNFICKDGEMENAGISFLMKMKSRFLFSLKRIVSRI